MKDTGGPAFPFWCDSNGMANFQGMTLRDYFAAMAMQGFCAGAEAGDDVGEIPLLSYIIANAMLAERNKT
jgi:hypothetical protein